MPNKASHLQCLCNAIHEPASLLESPTLPIETELCHCNPCRHGSGALCPAFTKLTGPPSSLDRCTRYSRPGGRVDRYFCSTCGSRTFDHATDNDYWYACSGIVEPVESVANVVKVTSHKYVADTGDGGLARLMPRIGGRDVPCYAEGLDDSLMTSADLMKVSEHFEGKREDKLHASCHCGSIQFYILPPEAAGESIQDPDVARWLKADGTKYLALNCACRYCRRAFGFSFASNTYVMPENIIQADNQDKSLFDYTSRDQTTSDYEISTPPLQALLPQLRFDFTSHGSRRSFCGVCGASIFFERTSRPQCVNVSVGILRANSGSLAKDWIDFDWQVWWREQVVDNDLAEALMAMRV